jgi:putative zinc finger/helix-turn-helix YgiT family protein
MALATVPYRVEIDHDGRAYTVDLPALTVPRCGNCGNLVLDEEANREISDALRRQVGLLTPAQIRAGRERLGLTQKDLARLLRVSDAALSRWETGAQIQQRSLDLLLRLYFESAWVRQVVADDAVVAGLGAGVSPDHPADG